MSSPTSTLADRHQFRGSGLSGSTGWHNSVRSRAYLTTVKTSKDEEPDKNLRMLQFKKSNYGPISQNVALRWENGVYKLVPSIGSLDKLAAEQHADDVFLKLLQRFEAEERDVSAKPSPLYAPKLFALKLKPMASTTRRWPPRCAGCSVRTKFRW